MCLSRRFGGKYGSWWTQLKKNTSRSGLDFVIYSALQLVLFHPMSALAAGINFSLGRRRTVYPLRQLARRYGIPVFSTREPNNETIVERIRSLQPDLIVVCYFDHIIRRPLIEVARCGVINIHPGLLPAMRGPAPNVWSIIEECGQVGVSVHFIDSETLDTGPLLKLHETARNPGESALALDCRLIRMGAELALEAITEIETGSARAIPQDASAGRYLSYPTRADLRRMRQQGGRLYRFYDFVQPFFAAERRTHDDAARNRKTP
jgi:methionyl-tRNA formyltransferase